MPKFSEEELAQAHKILFRVAKRLYSESLPVPDYVWTDLPGDDGPYAWAFERVDTGPFTSLSRLTAAAEEVTRRHAAQIERDARKKARSSSRKNPSPGTSTAGSRAAFRKSDRVLFIHPDGRRISGTVVKASASLIDIRQEAPSEGAGKVWKVHPSHVRRANGGAWWLRPE